MHLNISFIFTSLKKAEALTTHFVETCARVDYTVLWKDHLRYDFPKKISVESGLEAFLGSDSASDSFHAAWYGSNLQLGTIKISRGDVSMSGCFLDDEWRVAVYFCLYRQAYSPDIAKRLHEFALEYRSRYDAISVDAFAPAGDHTPNCIFINEETGPKWKIVENASPLLFEPWTAPFRKIQSN